MATKVLKTPPKTSVRIWQPILAKLDRKLDSACLRRDAYLNEVLKVELAWLEREVPVANSVAAQSFVTEQLDSLDRKLVSLALHPELLQRLNEICRAKRIVRDAFFNRLFLLLAAEPAIIDRVMFPGEGDWRQRVWEEHRWDSPAFQNVMNPLDPDINPFWALRTGLEVLDDQEQEGLKLVEKAAPNLASPPSEAAEPRIPTNLYTAYFDVLGPEVNLRGFNCYVPDFRVPGQEAEKRHRKELDALFADLGL